MTNWLPSGRNHVSVIAPQSFFPLIHSLNRIKSSNAIKSKKFMKLDEAKGVKSSEFFFKGDVCTADQGLLIAEEHSVALNSDSGIFSSIDVLRCSPKMLNLNREVSAIKNGCPQSDAIVPQIASVVLASITLTWSLRLVRLAYTELYFTHSEPIQRE